jgi:hypothetical protein
MSTFSGVGSPGSVGPTSGGKVYAYNNLTTTPAIVAPSNPARLQINFHNPGSVDVFVAPQNVVNSGSNVALSPTTSALGGCYRVFANGGDRTIVGECQGQWQAFALSGTGNPLTVTDSNV